MKTQETADFSVRKKVDPDFQCERNCYLFIYLFEVYLTTLSVSQSWIFI